MDVLYTTHQVGDILRKSDKTVRSYIRGKGLRASLVGNGYMIKQFDLMKFIQDRTVYPEIVTEY